MIDNGYIHSYTSLKELLSEINLGYDIEFIYNGVRYLIYRNQTYRLVEIDLEETEYQFLSGEELVNEYLINGKPLKDIWNKIKVY